MADIEIGTKVITADGQGEYLGRARGLYEELTNEQAVRLDTFEIKVYPPNEYIKEIHAT
jgi:hypothetical protein